MDGQIKGVANGLKYIHDLNGVHGDLKSVSSQTLMTLL